jgi:oligopeptide transport system ATP-binding protein
MSSKSKKNKDVLLQVKDLTVGFPIHGGIFMRQVGLVKAVDGVSFSVRRGETLGLVGESGCGKSTTGKACINLLRPTVPGVLLGGEVIYHSDDGPVNLQNLSTHGMRAYRDKIQMIFQDPYSSLNPRLTVGKIIEEPLLVHTNMLAKEREKKVKALLVRVGLGGEQAARYPHEFSGGQRQRIGIARALATEPEIIIADEPVSALDVSIQAQVINLMQELQDEFGIAYVFIAHDLSVVEHIADRIAVMYLGNIVELGSSDDIYFEPQHPYARALLSAVPMPDPDRLRPNRQVLEGDVPSPLAKPSGCGFRTRCPIAKSDCALEVPQLQKVEGRMVACPHTNEYAKALG